MKLAELLEHTAGELLDDRTALIDGANDSLFSDELIVRYMNEGMRRLCRRAWVLVDIGHPQAGTIVLVTGKDRYTLDKSVLRVLDATVEDDVSPLPRHGDVALRSPRPYNPDFTYDLSGEASTGRPYAFASDTATRQIRVYPTPTSTENGLRVTLRVVRMPYELLDVSKPDAEPEVSEEYHLALCDYAAGRCLTQSTSGDAGNKTEGRNLLDGFEALIKEARQDMTRAGMTSAVWNFASTTAVV